MYHDEYGAYPAPKEHNTYCGTPSDLFNWADSVGTCGGQWLTADPNFYKFMPSVPVDPRNVGVNAGLGDGNNVYSYYNAGLNDYNLVTQLEDPNDAARCETTPAYYHSDGQPDIIWCNGTSHSNNIYVDH